ncbi:MAG: hypothetical protein U1F43_12000 [Myxococcota bacterium]
MEDRLGQLAALDDYDSLYAPKMTRLRIWPLMKLGRYDEAIEAAQTLMRGDDLVDRVAAYNGLMAVEDERLDRVASYNWGKAGIENTQNRSCILFHNTAQAALTLFKFDEAEELARKAIRADYDDCPDPSYEHPRLHLSGGGRVPEGHLRLQEAGARAHRAALPAHVRQEQQVLHRRDPLSRGKFPEGMKLSRSSSRRPIGPA